VPGNVLCILLVTSARRIAYLRKRQALPSALSPSVIYVGAAFIYLDFYSPLFKVVDFVLLPGIVSAAERKRLACAAIYTPGHSRSELMTGNLHPLGAVNREYFLVFC